MGFIATTKPQLPEQKHWKTEENDKNHDPSTYLGKNYEKPRKPKQQ